MVALSIIVQHLNPICDTLYDTCITIRKVNTWSKPQLIIFPRKYIRQCWSLYPVQGKPLRDNPTQSTHC